MSSLCIYTKIVYCGLQDAISRGMLTFSQHSRRHHCSDGSTYATCHHDSMTKLVFLPSVDEILFEEVQNNLILYNITAVYYKNIMIKGNIRKEMSNKI